MRSKILFIPLLLSALFSARESYAGGDDMQRFIYAGCSAGKFSADSSYAYNVDSLLSSLANSAGFSLYTNFTSSLSAAASPAYGLYQCRADESISDCNSCVSSAISRLSSACPSAVSAAVQLRGCLVRYDNESFFCRPEKDLLYKRCGQPAPVAGGGVDVMASRESLFDTLKAGVGLYRVGRSGYVSGLAQCVGDQTVKGCGECVAEAVDNLRNICGGAVAGEAYFGTCYAEFWTMGQDYNPAPYDKNQHASEVGKDMAIIIGIVAAVLFIILYLNHLKKSSEDKGKY